MTENVVVLLQEYKSSQPEKQHKPLLNSFQSDWLLFQYSIPKLIDRGCVKNKCLDRSQPWTALGWNKFKSCKKVISQFRSIAMSKICEDFKSHQRTAADYIANKNRTSIGFLPVCLCSCGTCWICWNTPEPTLYPFPLLMSLLTQTQGKTPSHIPSWWC